MLFNIALGKARSFTAGQCFVSREEPSAELSPGNKMGRFCCMDARQGQGQGKTCPVGLTVRQCLITQHYGQSWSLSGCLFSGCLPNPDVTGGAAENSYAPLNMDTVVQKPRESNYRFRNEPTTPRPTSDLTTLTAITLCEQTRCIYVSHLLLCYKAQPSRGNYYYFFSENVKACRSMSEASLLSH